MKIPCVFTIFYLFCFVVELSAGDNKKELAACKEASTVLEKVMFFPMTMCEVPETSPEDKGWLLKVYEYTGTVNQQLSVAKILVTRTVEMVTSSLLTLYQQSLYQVDKLVLHTSQVVDEIHSNVNASWVAISTEADEFSDYFLTGMITTWDGIYHRAGPLWKRASSCITQTVDTAWMKTVDIATHLSSNITLYWDSFNIGEIQGFCRGAIHSASETALNLTKELRKGAWEVLQRTKGAVRNMLSVLSHLATISGMLATLFIIDISLSLKAGLSSMWNESLAVFMTSPCLCVRYTVAVLVAMTLPISVYILVREIPNALRKSKLKRPSIQLDTDDHGHVTTVGVFGQVYKYLRLCLKLKLQQLQQVCFIEKMQFPKQILRMNPEQTRSGTLKLLHYRMCEVYDGSACNCGGRSSPVGGRIRPSFGKHGRGKKFTLTPAHYPMCEQYDGLPCNCGSYLSVTNTKQPTMSPKIVFVPPDMRPKRQKETTKQQYGPKTPPVLDDKPVVALEHQEKKPCIDNQEVTEHEPNSTSVLTEVSMIDDIEMDTEIGHPQLNSSFIEGSPYTCSSALSDSAYSDMGMGDGLPLHIITRRSPRKECGVSFVEEDDDYDDDDDDEPSYLADTTYTEDDSLLDVSDINKSLSFNSGDGVYEFVIMYALQTVFRTAKRMFQPKLPKARDQSRDLTIGNLSRDKYFIVPKIQTNPHRNRKPAVNKNRSAIRDIVCKNSSIHDADDSLTDNDTMSDLSGYYGNDTSVHAVPCTLESWTLSPSKDDSSFLLHNKPPGNNSVPDTNTVSECVKLPGNNSVPDKNTVSECVKPPGNNSVPDKNTVSECVKPPGNNSVPDTNTVSECVKPPGNNSVPDTNTVSECVKLPGNNSVPDKNTVSECVKPPGNNSVPGKNAVSECVPQSTQVDTEIQGSECESGRDEIVNDGKLDNEESETEPTESENINSNQSNSNNIQVYPDDTEHTNSENINTNQSNSNNNQVYLDDRSGFMTVYDEGADDLITTEWENVPMIKRETCSEDYNHEIKNTINSDGNLQRIQTGDVDVEHPVIDTAESRAASSSFDESEQPIAGYMLTDFCGTQEVSADSLQLPLPSKQTCVQEQFHNVENQDTDGITKAVPTVNTTNVDADM